MFFERLKSLLSHHLREGRLWYDPDYRPPLSGIEAPTGFEPRRADYAVWYLLQVGRLASDELRSPLVASYAEMARVHTPEYLEALSRPEALAHIYAVDPSDVVVAPLMRTVRLAVGGTLAAARETLLTKKPCLNTLGGFHHAAPGRGAGFCAVNDIAVAIAALRADGFAGKVAVLDFDAHPPDGTAECLKGDPDCFLGSLSGSDWGPLERVDETVLPQGADDRTYLAALDRLLSRVPKVDLAFVIAGGDVLAGDRLGKLGLTVDGVRRRDLRVGELLSATPSVWLPGGGYGPSAWRVLAGTWLAVVCGSVDRIPPRADPLTTRFAGIARDLEQETLGSEPLLTADDVEEALTGHRPGRVRLLGFYTPDGIEFALYRFGVLHHVQRLGYERPHVEIDAVGSAHRLRLMGEANGATHLLIEAVVERLALDGGSFLFVNWLSLRNPRAKFSDKRPQLPGQEVPGLGLARETGEMLALMAKRLVLDGVAFRPAWYHMAYAARYRFRFVNPARQGRFEALMRDLKEVPLREATQAVADGRVLLNGAPYAWEPTDMAYWLRHPHLADDQSAVERERAHFSLLPISGPAPKPPAP
jgi:acetoin utilization deacetylase AcuC-like enzyme